MEVDGDPLRTIAPRAVGPLLEQCNENFRKGAPQIEGPDDGAGRGSAARSPLSTPGGGQQKLVPRRGAGLSPNNWLACLGRSVLSAQEGPISLAIQVASG